MDTPDELKAHADVEQLKAEISETQAELQETVAAIQDRLSPAHLREQAATSVRRATRAQIVRMQHMMNPRNNAIPYTLIGIGAAWLLANRRSNGGWNGYRERTWDGATTTADSRATHSEFTSQYSDSEHSRMERWRTAASDRTAAATDRARQAARRARRTWSTMLDDNPVALGLAALAAGALVGAALPATEMENDYLGPARDSTVDSAREAAKTAVQNLAE